MKQRKLSKLVQRLKRIQKIVSIGTIHKPFWGYDFCKWLALIIQTIGINRFDFNAKEMVINNFLTYKTEYTGNLKNIKDQQTMIEDGHLGGFIYEGALGTYNPLLWECLIDLLSIESILDIGCGRGFSVQFFAKKVPIVLGIEGSLKAIETNLIPDKVNYHDYTKGISSITSTFNMGWCCEVVEHIEEKYLINLISDFKKCRFLLLTYALPGQGGYHHVNEQFALYWIKLLTSNGFIFAKHETEIFRKVAQLDEVRNRQYNHFAHKGLFFINKKLATGAKEAKVIPEVFAKKV